MFSMLHYVERKYTVRDRYSGAEQQPYTVAGGVVFTAAKYVEK